MDIYLASIHPILTYEDYDWLANQELSKLKLWTTHESFAGGGYGYSSTATKALNNSLAYELSNTEKLKLFTENYYQGKEDEALGIIFLNSKELDFMDILVPEMNLDSSTFCLNEPPIISLAALLLNQNFNHESFLCLQYFITSKFPTILITQSETPIHSLIAQLIELIRSPLKIDLFCNLQKCLSFLLLMIGQPLLALDCLCSVLKASSECDPIILSRICALIRVLFLSFDGTNPLIHDLSKDDLGFILSVWQSICPLLESYINPMNSNIFEPARNNYNLLMAIEKELLLNLNKI